MTFRCYGTWLHGDVRGSVDREHNSYGAPLVAPSEALRIRRTSMLKGAVVVLEPEHRAVVEQTLREVSAHRGWALHAINVRTNHVHAVVSGPCVPERILSAWKSWSTRRPREAGLIAPSGAVWSRHGSTRYLWTQESLADACIYVDEGQSQGSSPLAADP